MKPMEKELLNALVELKSALDEDPRVKKLQALEQEMMANDVVIALAKKKDALERDYEDILSYRKETSPEAQAAQKALYEAKLALDQHPLVARYNAAYIPVRDLYMQIDDILYAPFRKKSLFEEAH
jgi:cell fate (sporulation/competence/biofilm development) regulator YlbF (YheA/YmcA/DUF963 family)